MNVLVEKGYLVEKKCGSNLSFILHENSMFLNTEYKVLQSQANASFVKCMKMFFNGKMQLYYLTQSYKPLSMLLSTLDTERLMTVVINLFSDIIDVKNNGFLSCQNIDISFEHIYVDPSTYKVSLIYLPLNKRIYDDYSAFENILRIELIKTISNLNSVASAKTSQLIADLSNGTLGLEEICSKTKGGQSGMLVGDIPKKTKYVEEAMKQLVLVAMDAPSKTELEVTKEEFTIGKDPITVDGVISYNKTISRTHCKIFKQGGKYFVTDLNSTNGTYLNNIRVTADQGIPMKEGDMLRLSNSMFKVDFR